MCHRGRKTAAVIDQLTLLAVVDTGFNAQHICTYQEANFRKFTLLVKYVLTLRLKKVMLVEEQRLHFK